MSSTPETGEDPEAAPPGYRTAESMAGEEAVTGFVDSLDPVGGHLADLVIETVFDKLYRRPGLSHPEREMVTLAVLAALGDTESQLTLHLGIAHRLGIAPSKVIEIFAHTSAYAGFPRALNAVETAKQFYGELGVLPLAQNQQAR
ncbi:carboxymuconolactone decarboxylase family protein [Streptomyces ziwulingensis]|uniref:Carboxymuconolactone decarboxylase family protein n=1 Tax=Streptomyces ziwulingensis TaxID=1045501 RepID=A0ABP9CMU8_9ACTN